MPDPSAEGEALRLIAHTLDTRVVLDYQGIAATLREVARRVDGLAARLPPQAFTKSQLVPHSSA